MVREREKEKKRHGLQAMRRKRRRRRRSNIRRRRTTMLPGIAIVIALSPVREQICLALGFSREGRFEMVALPHRSKSNFPFLSLAN